jgi:RHS repeat-associated protein
MDANGQVSSVSIAGVAPLIFEYDSRGRLSSAAQGDRSTSQTYDTAGRVASTKDALGRTSPFAYDAVGRLTSATRPDGASTEFSYDAAGNVTSITPPGKPPHLFSYDPDNRLDSYTAPDAGEGAAVTTYEYDKDGAPTEITLPDGNVIGMKYDAAGRLSTLTTPAGDTTVVYNATTGTVTSVKGPYGEDVAYTYAGPLLAGTTWSGRVSGTVDRTYDNFFRIATETVNGQPVAKATVTYDDDGLITAVATSAATLTLAYDPHAPRLETTALGGVTDARTYDTFGDLATYTAKFGTTALFDVTYIRDALGRIRVKDESVQATAKRTEYGYDDAGRLISVAEAGMTVRTYAYDENGNRTTFDDPEHQAKPKGKYDAQDGLLTYGTFAYTYTKDGALRTKTDTSNGQVTTYTYDALGNLTKAELPTGKVVEYVVDPEQRRVGKEVDGVLQRRWLWANQLQVAAELDGSGALVSRFVYGNRVNVPDYMIKAGEAYRIITDHLSSVRLVVKERDGSVAQRIDRDEFGNVTSDTNPGFQPFGFAGGLFDVDTGLVRFGARDYDAQAGRWTSKDPILFGGQQTNLYSYAAGDPVNLTDPNGKFWWVVGGAVAGAGLDLAGQLSSGCEVDWGEVGGWALGGALLGGGIELAAAGAGLAERAAEIHEALDPIAQGMRTTAVLDTSVGRIVAGGARDLTPAQRALLGAGEIGAKLPGAHAEITAMEAARGLGATPEAMAVTRAICPACAAAIEASGGTLTGPNTAIWLGPK